MSGAEAVRRLLARYCQFMDDRRFDEWSALFAPDAVWVLGERAFHGRSEMHAYMSNLARERPVWRTRHLCHNLVIALDGDHGAVTSDLAMLARDGDGDGIWRVVSLGRYRDRLADAGNGEWQFTERRLDVL